MDCSGRGGLRAPRGGDRGGAETEDFQEMAALHVFPAFAVSIAFSRGSLDSSARAAFIVARAPPIARGLRNGKLISAMTLLITLISPPARPQNTRLEFRRCRPPSISIR